MRAPSCCSASSHAPSPRRDLEDGLVGRDLVQDLRPKVGLVSLTDAFEVAERTVETHPAVNHPGAALGEGHQVDFVVATFAPPRERPAGWARLIAQPAAAAQLLPIDGGELSLDQRVERDQELEELLAVVVDPTLELEICLGDRHLGS